MRLSFYYLQGPCHTIHKSRGKCAEFFVLIFLPPREVIYILPRNDLPSQPKNVEATEQELDHARVFAA